MRLGYLWCQKLSAKEGRGNRRKVEEREEEKRNNGKEERGRGKKKGEREKEKGGQNSHNDTDMPHRSSGKSYQ